MQELQCCDCGATKSIDEFSLSQRRQGVMDSAVRKTHIDNMLALMVTVEMPDLRGVPGE